MLSFYPQDKTSYQKTELTDYIGAKYLTQFTVFNKQQLDLFEKKPHHFNILNAGIKDALIRSPILLSDLVLMR